MIELFKKFCMIAQHKPILYVGNSENIVVTDTFLYNIIFVSG